jgi:hypothetical protein
MASRMGLLRVQVETRHLDKKLASIATRVQLTYDLGSDRPNKGTPQRWNGCASTV